MSAVSSPVCAKPLTGSVMTTAQHMAWLNAIRHEIHMRHQFQSEPCEANLQAWNCAKTTLNERTPK